jgi:hypothetical protein
VEIDLQTTLASRSKASGDPQNDASRGLDSETDSSYKLAITPYFSGVVPTVTVESARSLESDDVIETEWPTHLRQLRLGDEHATSEDSTGTGTTITRETVSRGPLR